jgi:hypothetical protein
MVTIWIAPIGLVEVESDEFLTHTQSVCARLSTSTVQSVGKRRKLGWALVMTQNTNMKKLIAVTIVVIAGMQLSSFVQGQTRARVTPDALVKDLYNAHAHKRGPFFQTRSRPLLYKYFVKSLADLIWNDVNSSKDEVGIIDGDPLYDAQDMEIKKLAIGNASYEGGSAKVVVTFENFGQSKTIVFLLVNSKTGWRIDDIDYGEGRTLRSEFKSAV